MISDCPSLIPVLVMGDNARLLAKISSVLAQRGSYVPLVDGPRLKRMDAEVEVIRRNNAAARVQPKAIIFAGLAESVRSNFAGRFPAKRCFAVEDIMSLRRADHGLPMRPKKVLTWGRSRIGVGLFTALNQKREIEFSDIDTPEVVVTSRSVHLVACEDGDDFAQVLAANYAYSIDADFCLIPSIRDEDADQLLERLYGLYDDAHNAPSQTLQSVKDELRSRAGPIPVENHRCITFISREMPWGFGFPEVPSTHIFKYPDLGIALINGVAAEQPSAPGLRVAAVVNPGVVQAPEVLFAAENLAEKGTLVRGFRGPAATVRDIGHMVELLPYDFLLLATHCGDASGWRFTYEYMDSEGIERNLIVDTAIGVAEEPGNDKVAVMQFTKFVSLDGVDWQDRTAKARLYVGQAINDYLSRDEAGEGLKPVKREEIPRVRWSSALRMQDHNFILPPVQLADYGSPIVLNNACGSWHRLAATFTFGNARAYIGTLFPVTDLEAEEVVKGILGRHFGKPLAVALWQAQNDVYQGTRQPYLLVGPHFQKLRRSTIDAPNYLLARIGKATRALEKRMTDTAPLTDSQRRTLSGHLEYLNFEKTGLLAKFAKHH